MFLQTPATAEFEAIEVASSTGAIKSTELGPNLWRIENAEGISWKYDVDLIMKCDDPKCERGTLIWSKNP